MIPDEKLFDIIKYAGENGFDISISGRLAIVCFSMCDEHVIRYHHQASEVKIIVNDKIKVLEYDEEYKENPVECSINYLVYQNEYYQDMLKLATMLNESIIPSDEVGQ